jgi:hypothetical protein
MLVLFPLLGGSSGSLGSNDLAITDNTYSFDIGFAFIEWGDASLITFRRLTSRGSSSNGSMRKIEIFRLVVHPASSLRFFCLYSASCDAVRHATGRL